MKKKELLKEIMGVPKAITPWSKSLSQLIYDDVSKLDEWAEEGPVRYTNKEGELVEDMAVRMDEQVIPGNEVMDYLAEINGFSTVKEFVESEMFQKLPLWRPVITYKFVGIPTELYKLEGDGKYNAMIGTNELKKLSKIGKHKVLSDVHMHFDILVDRNDPLNKLKENLLDTIAHELTHAYQKVKQLQSGKPGHFGKEGALNALIQNPLLDNVTLGWWKNFLNLVYLHLSFEVNARVSQIYYLLKDRNINTKEDFLKELKKTSMWEQMKMLEDFNAENYIEEFELPITEFDENNPLQMLDNMIQGVDLASQGVDPRSKEAALKSLIDLWDKTLYIGNEGMKQMGLDITMDNVPKSAKESPLKFFKFFEKRFNKKAEKWKRKLYRIGALLLQEREEELKQEKIGESILKEERVVNFNQPNNNFVVVAGGPGVGKSFITNNLINLNNIRYFNVDVVRELIAKKLWGDEWAKNMSTPEGYQKVLDLTHTTSDPRNVTIKFLKNFLQIDRKEGVNVVYDAGGGQKKVMKDVWEMAKDNGFKTTLVYVRTPLEVAQERNVERPRSLPSEMVANYHKKVKDNIRYLIDKFDNVWFVDNKDTIDISDRPTENIERIK